MSSTITVDGVTGGAHAEPQLGSFRAELAEWLGAHLTEEVVRAGHEGVEHGDNLSVLRRWNRLLADGGWAAVSWPVEFGGRARESSTSWPTSRRWRWRRHPDP